MNPVQLNLSPACQLVGQLYESNDLDELSEDMLEVHLPSGLSIEAGWIDLAYLIQVCRGMELLREVKVEDVLSAKCEIESLADHFQGEPSQDNENEYRRLFSCSPAATDYKDFSDCESSTPELMTIG